MGVRSYISEPATYGKFFSLSKEHQQCMLPFVNQQEVRDEVLFTVD